MMPQVQLPFRGITENTEYNSQVWPGLVLTHKEQHLLMELPEDATSLSSAVYGGGMGYLRYIVNQYVDKNYDCSDPVRDMEQKLGEWGYPLDKSAGLMTAVPLQHAAIGELDIGSAGIVCCVTAGAGNAARAGVERPVLQVYRPGTINILLGINGLLNHAAMVNTIITAVEAKAAALADLGITDAANGLIATGTTTDAIILAVSQNRSYHAEHVYAGTATDLGGAIGKLVHAALTASLNSVMSKANVLRQSD